MSYRDVSLVDGPRALGQRGLSVCGGLVVAWLALLPTFVGCGKGEPKLSSASTYLIEARRAVGDGDLDGALKALDASIASQPNAWAYLERARIYATQGKDAEALADCEALLKLEPDNRDAPWIKGEVKKPVDKRFQGDFATPPSYKK